jgi:pilus assembly protein Flp/PilA
MPEKKPRRKGAAICAKLKLLPKGVRKLQTSGASVRPRRFQMRRRTLAEFLKDDAAATSIEYALIAAFVSIMIAASARAIGTKLSANYYGPLGAGFN